MQEISIITINYNNNSGLTKTAKSILNQKNLNFEWIVVDGKSEDNSIDNLESYIKNFSDKVPSIKIYSSKDNGIYDAMNKGSSLASGKWCLYLNSGDIFTNPYCINKILDDLIEFNKFQILFYGFKYKKINRYSKPKFWSLWKMITSHQSMVFSSDIYKKIHYDISYKYSADYDLILKILNMNYRYKHVRYLLVENEPYGSYDNHAEELKEYCVICKKYYPLVVCRLIGVIRYIYDYLKIGSF